MNKNSFIGKSVIVTGGSSGIGRASSLLFAERGAKVLVSDINTELGTEVIDIIKSKGGIATFVKTDVTNNDQVIECINTCIKEFGGLDFMINNAGIGGSLSFFDQITDNDWSQIIGINQTGVFYCMRAALIVMKEQSKGCIVNTSSVAGLGAAPRMGAYSASKHAVVGMTKTAAVEYAKFGIRINAVCPSVINTPMGDSYTNDNHQITEMIKQSIPMKRFGTAEEVAATICWLCSDDASFITGQAIRVDGGHMT